MLILSRKKNESLILRTEAGERIEIRFVDRKGAKVRIGVTAAKSVVVLRKELEAA